MKYEKLRNCQEAYKKWSDKEKKTVSRNACCIMNKNVQTMGTTCIFNKEIRPIVP